VIHRRQLLAGSIGAMVVGLARAAHAADHLSDHWRLLDIVLGGDKRIGTRFTLLVPKRKQKVPLLVALHGLGETHDQRIGAYAWLDRYGLGSAYDRLCEPPIGRANDKHRYWTDDRLAAVNRMLEAKPFRGLAIACPYTPNVYKAARGRKVTLDLYAEWIVDEVVPRARKDAHGVTGGEHTSLDGCSLGGYVGIEVFLRKAAHFGAWGSLQGALGAHRIAGYADKLVEVIGKHGPRAIHIESSTNDAFRSVNEKFARMLTKRGVPHDFIMPPGPHNQLFLRDSGTLEMLLWYDRLRR
jgi:hypothetical protein